MAIDRCKSAVESPQVQDDRRRLARNDAGCRTDGVGRFCRDEGIVFAIFITGISLSLAVAADASPAGFQRTPPTIATDGVKPGVRQGRVSKESLSIAACRTRAARHGEATYKELRLAGRQTFLVTGTIIPSREERRRSSNRAASRWTFSCTVRGEGEIVAFKTEPALR
jgi:hypothetical protein